MANTSLCSFSQNHHSVLSEKRTIYVKTIVMFFQKLHVSKNKRKK